MSEHPEEPKVGGVHAEAKKARSAYSQLPFDLLADELTQSGTQKMLLGEVERLNAEVGELKDFQKKYHEVHTKFEVLSSQFQQYTALEILYTMGVGAAFAVFGWLPSVSPWTARHTVALVGAAVMVGVAIWGKWKGVRHEG